MRGVRRQCDQAGAVEEIAEAFIVGVVAFGGIARQQRFQCGQDLRLGDVFAVQRVEPLAAAVATSIRL